MHVPNIHGIISTVILRVSVDGVYCLAMSQGEVVVCASQYVPFVCILSYNKPGGMCKSGRARDVCYNMQ